MADSVNRVWISMDLGNFNIGRKVSAFFGGDTYADVETQLVSAFGQLAADQIFGHIAQLTTEEAFDNLKTGGLVGADTPASSPSNTSSGPVCQHGPKVLKTSKPGAPKTWRAWMCPAPQGDPTQCKPEWL